MNRKAAFIVYFVETRAFTDLQLTVTWFAAYFHTMPSS